MESDKEGLVMVEVENDVEEQKIPVSSSTEDSMSSTKKRTNALKASKPGTVVKRRLKKKEKEDASTKIIKYAALLLLVAQMVGLVLLMRYTRTHQRPNQPLYLASTAVFVMEVMKFVICCIVVAIQSGGDLIGEFQEHVVGAPAEVIKLCVPSLLYTVQNNLLYLALTNLDAATYQVCYQLKILTTAVFSAILLHRKFSRTKWAALVILTVGVAIVQVSGSGDQNTQNTSSDKHNRLIGLIAVLCAACTSGFSGVYFEKILKGSTTSLWIRNIQMGLPSVIIAYLTIYAKDASAVASQGFLGGYTPMVWTVVTVQAVGGLIVAVVVKYADNVLKVFASSFSIVISCIISALLFAFRPTFSFVVGASLVVLATIMYSSPEKRRRRKPVLPMTANGKK
jgi:UDP-sugar transporter A1/2/3